MPAILRNVNPPYLTGSIGSAAIQYRLHAESTVSDLTIRPTAKFIIVRFVLTGLVFLALEIAYFAWWKEKDKEGLLHLLPFIAPIIFLPAFLRLIKRQFTTVTLSGDRLRFESGFVGKTTRTVQMSKVQDVRVDQRPMQRIFKVGDISIETAGESSRETIPDVDNPHVVSDEILSRGHGAEPGVR